MIPTLKLCRAIVVVGLLGCGVDAPASSIFSLKSFDGGAGSIYMVRSGKETPLGDFIIRGIAFSSDATYIVPHSKMEMIHSDNCSDSMVSLAKSSGNTGGCFINFPDSDADISISTNRSRSGQIEGLFRNSGEMVLALDISVKSPTSNTSTHIPIYAVTGRLPIPPACNGGLDEKTEKRGLPGFIEGAIGDGDNNGFIDGKLVAVGFYTPDPENQELECFILTRNFSTDIPYRNYLVGRLPNGGSGTQSTTPITVLSAEDGIR